MQHPKVHNLYANQSQTSGEREFESSEPQLSHDTIPNEIESVPVI